MQKTKILVHVSDEYSYKSFLRSIYDNDDNLEILGASLHSNLFDVCYQAKPNILILPANEYTQEFHDFINENSNKLQIVLFINGKIENKQLIDFWYNKNILCCGKSEYIDHESIDKSLIYNMLYDSSIFNCTDRERNDKVAVLLSVDDQINDSVIGNMLYPLSKEKLVLFNSSTYKKNQNVGFLTPIDMCEVFNTYKSLIDIDNKYAIEANVCGIENISIDDDDLIDNLSRKITKPYINNIEQSSYSYFIKNIFLPKVIKG
jgi:hypothetical protein